MAQPVPGGGTIYRGMPSSSGGMTLLNAFASGALSADQLGEMLDFHHKAQPGPYAPVPLPYELNNAQTHEQISDVYEGVTQSLGTRFLGLTLQKALSDVISPGAGLPLQVVNALRWELKRVKHVRRPWNQRAEQAPDMRTNKTSETLSWEMGQYGREVVVSQERYMDRGGPQEVAREILNTSIDMSYTLYLNFFEECYNADLFSREYIAARYASARGLMVQDMAMVRAAYFMCFQRAPRRAIQYFSEMTRSKTEDGAMPTALWVTSAAQPYLYEQGPSNAYVLAGPAGPARERRNPYQPIQEFAGKRVLTTLAFNPLHGPGNESRDPLAGRAQVGTFNAIVPPINAPLDYTTEGETRAIHDMFKDEMRPVTLDWLNQHNVLWQLEEGERAELDTMYTPGEAPVLGNIPTDVLPDSYFERVADIGLSRGGVFMGRRGNDDVEIRGPSVYVVPNNGGDAAGFMTGDSMASEPLGGDKHKEVMLHLGEKGGAEHAASYAAMLHLLGSKNAGRVLQTTHTLLGEDRYINSGGRHVRAASTHARSPGHARKSLGRAASELLQAGSATGKRKRTEKPTGDPMFVPRDEYLENMHMYQAVNEHGEPAHVEDATVHPKKPTAAGARHLFSGGGGFPFHRLLAQSTGDYMSGPDGAQYSIKGRGDPGEGPRADIIRYLHALPVTQATYQAFLDHDLPPPFGFMVARPFGLVHTDSAILLVPGADTGRMRVSRVRHAVNLDATTFTQEQHFIMHARAMIEVPERVTHIPNAVMRGYVSGCGMLPFTVEKLRGLTHYGGVQDERGVLPESIIVLPVPPNFHDLTSNVVDLRSFYTGEAPPQGGVMTGLEQDRALQAIEHFPGATFWAKKLGFDKLVGEDPLEMMCGRTAGNLNTVCLRAFQQKVNKAGTFEDEVIGVSAFGERMWPGWRNQVERGKPLEDPTRPTSSFGIQTLRA